MRLEDAEMLKAQYWPGVVAELQEKIEKAMNCLVMCSEDEVVRLQERIITLREVMTLPEEIIERQTVESYRRENA